MRRISLQTRRKIVELWFKGDSRDKIGRKVGVSGETVSREVGLLPEFLREFRKLSVELKKYNLTLVDARKGTKLHSELSSIGFNLDQLAEFIETVKALSQKADYEPKRVVKAAAKLAELERESGKRYTEAIAEYETITAETQKLKQEFSTLQKQVTDESTKFKQMLRRKKTTYKQIKSFTTTRQNLRHYGISLADVENLQKFLKNMEETNYNPRNFVKFTRKMGSLKGTITRLEKQKQQKTLELNKTKTEISELRSQISEFRRTLIQLQEETEKYEKIKREVVEDLKKMYPEYKRLEDGILQKSGQLRLVDCFSDILMGKPFEIETLWNYANNLRQLSHNASPQAIASRKYYTQEIVKMTRNVLLDFFKEHLAPKEEVEKLKEENEGLKILNSDLSSKNESLEKEVDRWSKENSDLKKELKKATNSLQELGDRFLKDPLISGKKDTNGTVLNGTVRF